MSPLLHHLLEEAAQRDPSAVAIRCNGESLTYGELARRAYGLAHHLVDGGLERGERVAVLLRKGFEVPAAFYGVFAAGGALVPIDPRSPAEQVIRILRATGARRLITEPAKAAVARQVVEACPELREVLGLDSAALAGEESEKHLNANANANANVTGRPWSSILEAATERRPPVEVLELDTSYVLHTSGSTGIPKLIRHTHHSAMSFVEWAAAEYGLTPADRLSNHSSHHTCFATFDYYAAARAGAATVLLTPAVMMMPASLSALLEKEKVSVWYSVPTALVQLSLRGEMQDRDLSALRWVLFAGETFPQKHLQRLRQQLPGARFSHVYGSTEANVCTYYHLPENPVPDGPLPIGKACPNSSTLVVDENLQPVPPGGSGELLVRGSTVMSGYWDEPERNRQALIRRPAGGGFDQVYYRTGDQVRTLENGDLTFVARTDFQIKVRGFRVELGEVETALLALDEVAEACAFAVPDSEGSSSLRAAIVPSPGADPDPRDVLRGLREHLPIHAIPAEVAVLQAFPRTPTNKVDRKALQAKAQTQAQAKVQA
ncbi:MAG: amino acid adenylation domain-containing protein [Acidobacteriota bacterium]